MRIAFPLQMISWESKRGEEGLIAAGPSFCLKHIRDVSCRIVLQESNHLWPAYHASQFQWIFAISSEVPVILVPLVHHHYSALISKYCQQGFALRGLDMFLFGRWRVIRFPSLRRSVCLRIIVMNPWFVMCN